MKLSERKAFLTDEKWLWGIYKGLLQESINVQWGWNEVFQIKSFNANLPILKFRIISTNSIDVAAYLANDEPEHIYVKMVLIIKEYQNMGIGHKIMLQLQEHAAKNNKQLKLSVIKANSDVDFYKKLGFQACEENDGSLEMIWRL